MASAAPAAAAAPEPKKKKSGLGVLIGAVVLVLILAGGGAWFFLHGQGEEAAKSAEGGHGADAAPPAPAVYLALDPAFVVNLEDPDAPRYLQAEVQVMTRDPAGIEEVKAQMPRIRNALLLLFGQQKSADLTARSGKEALQAAALAEVQKVMQAETGKPVVEAVYFTSFVMQ